MFVRLCNNIENSCTHALANTPAPPFLSFSLSLSLCKFTHADTNIDILHFTFCTVLQCIQLVATQWIPYKIDGCCFFYPFIRSLQLSMEAFQVFCSISLSIKMLRALVSLQSSRPFFKVWKPINASEQISKLSNQVSVIIASMTSVASGAQWKHKSSHWKSLYYDRSRQKRRRKNLITISV